MYFKGVFSLNPCYKVLRKPYSLGKMDLIYLYKMKNLLIVLLFVIGLVMIYLGAFNAPKLMLPPVLSGVAFLLIAYLFYNQD